jgi:hypothetical protein
MFQSHDAVNLFRKLLLAEAHTMGLLTMYVETPLSINIADGGIDAEVNAITATRVGQGLIEANTKNYYQIKTGDFEIQQPNKVREILFDTKSEIDESGNPKKDSTSKTIKRLVLKPRVQECFDANSVFHIVLFGWDFPNDRDAVIVETFRAELQANGYNYLAPKVRICRASKIISYLSPFPSLQLAVSRQDQGPLRSWTSWALDADMAHPYHPDPQRKQHLQTLVQALTTSTTEAQHIRIKGDAGIGKTRLSHEATRTLGLSVMTIYAESPDDLDSSDLLNSLLHSDSTAEVVLIVDECNDEDARNLWKKLKTRGPRIRFITIDIGDGSLGGNVRQLELPELDDEQVKAILNNYGIAHGQLDRWVKLCGGSPRVAHLLGVNLRDHPDDDNLLQEPDWMVVWQRFIAGTEAPNDPVVRQRELILRHLALFERVGYLKEFKAEFDWLAGKVQAHDPNTTPQAFQTQVASLRQRKVLQGSASIHINPKALQIKLWTDWWQHHGDHFDLDAFTRDMPLDLLDAFYASFKFAAVSEVARGRVRALLGPGGYFENNERLQFEREAKFFLALAEADPASALQCLERTIGRWDLERLKNSKGSRRSLVWALEKIAVWGDLCRGAAELLLRLGEAENETWTNNASGVFASLFSLGYGDLAPTEASPNERFPVLEAALASASPEKRALALRALTSALQLDIVRTLGAEVQGLRRHPQLWMPATRTELNEAYTHAWTMLDGAIDRLDGEERIKAIEIAFGQGSRMLFYPPLDEAVLATFERLTDVTDATTWRGLVEVVDGMQFHRDQLATATLERLDALRVRLEGNSFSARLRRWVSVRSLPDNVAALTRSNKPVQPELERLSTEALEDPERLNAELAWLNTSEAQNGTWFGEVLAKCDVDFSLWTRIRSALARQGDSGNAFFIAGYLSTMRKRDAERWSREMDRILDDAGLRLYAVELAWRTGVTDAYLGQLIAAVRQNDIAVEQFELLAYGSSLEDVDPIHIYEVATLLLERGGRCVFVALSLWHAYYVHPFETAPVMPEESTWAVLTAGLDATDFANATMDDFRWNGVAKAFIKHYPDRSVRLAETMIAYLGKTGTILAGFLAQSLETLNEIARAQPSEIWRVVSALLPARDSQAHHVALWLRGHVGAGGVGAPNIISLVPQNRLLEWVAGEVEERAWYLATLVPATLGDEGDPSLARQLLVQYGERDDVRRNLLANFQTEGWMGEMSVHYEKKRDRLVEIRALESDPKVRRWLQDFIDGLDKTIEWSKGQEERSR